MITTKLRPNTYVYLDIPDDMDNDLVSDWEQKLGVKNKTPQTPILVNGPVNNMSGHDLVILPDGRAIVVNGIKEVSSLLYRESIELEILTAIGDVTADPLMKAFVVGEITSRNINQAAIETLDKGMPAYFNALTGITDLVRNMEEGKFVKAPLAIHGAKATLTGTLRLISERIY